MDILTYPSYLAGDDYALRKITFTAMKNDACDSEAEQMLQKALNTATAAIEAGWSDIAGTSDALAAPEGFTSMGQIVLPIPAQINDESSHQWNAETGIVHDAIHSGASALGSMISPGGRIGSLISAMKSGVSGAGGLDKILATGAMLSGRRKPLLDPGYFQNYTGSQPRSFNMQWNLIPQNSAESQVIHDIIMTFKRWAAPSRALAGVVMLSPYFFSIQMSNPMISGMLNMNNCVCTRVECAYSSQIFPDGMPKQISLSLGFNESRLTYADNYHSAIGGAPMTSTNSVKPSAPKVTNNPLISALNKYS